LLALPAIAFFDHRNVVKVVAEAGCWLVGVRCAVRGKSNTNLIFFIEQLPGMVFRVILNFEEVEIIILYIEYQDFS